MYYFTTIEIYEKEYNITNIILNASEISQRIDFIRRQKGLSQDELATVLRVSQPAISKYLRDRIPPAETLLRLAELGHTTIEWILLGQKSYLSESGVNGVKESTVSYDSDWQLAKKMAALTPKVKEAILVLIAELDRQAD